MSEPGALDHGGGTDVAPETIEARVGVLRGAAAGGDTRRIARIGVGVLLATVAGLILAFSIAGVQRNAHVTALRHDGVPVAVRVSNCRGLLGGSGSNAAGYTCRGTFVLNGRTYEEGIPGNSPHPPGSTVEVIAVRNDPGIIALPNALRTEQASLRVFLLPALLLVGLLALCAALWWRRRSAQIVGGLGPRGTAAP